MAIETISPELLDILRCPYCVSGDTRMSGDDPGRLELVADGQWLYAEDSGYKYPIREGIPVMLIEEGRKWKDTPIEQLPAPGPLVDPAQVSRPDAVYDAPMGAGQDIRLYLMAGAVLVALMLFIAALLSRKKSS